MTRRINLQAITGAERHQAIEALREAITDAGGWIVDFRLFSNLALSVIIEIGPAGLSRLIERLDRIEISLTEESRRSVPAPPPAPTDEEIRVLFNLTFRGGDGELRLPIPAIPG